MVGSYQVGDTVSYCREARAGVHGLQWSVGSKLIGVEKDRNSLGETQRRTCWILCDSVPLCVAVDRLRLCTSAELLAFHYTQTESASPLTADAQTQQGFIDERAPLHNPTVDDPSRTADEDECEDEQDCKMSDPAQITSAEKQEGFQMDETQEQHERSSKQARTAEKGVETPQDVSCLFQKGHCEHQRNEFLQVRIA